ncbi:MAG: 50S ribosomal protein L3 [Candidatus Thermoplasmatota archaeon]|jgi:large subunit ribosomal protein L3|nr:50S ribosomal protein L3 [Candidatus Thermoplasmatota archaeon]MCL5786202.1 50S ribosomal protein L3 [Candidatus Thermoplasmatota archaeon]
MATPHHPRRGSKGYYPRVRAKREHGFIRSWPELDGKAKIQAFAGYKVGMTHVEMVDYRKNSVTAGQSVFSAVTIVEVPPLKVAAIRFYSEGSEGLYVSAEKWAEKLDDSLLLRIPRTVNRKKSALPEDLSDVRLVVHTEPALVTGIPKKVPEIFEVRIGGDSMESRVQYAESKLGQDLRFTDFSGSGKFVDVIGVTKGKGFTGHVERFGVKLLPRKNRKHRRMIGTLGPWHPNFVKETVPQAGQMGYQQRTAHNIRVIKYGTAEESSSVNVKGGNVGYGLVRNDFVLLHGSIPGPSHRLVKMRDPARQKSPDVKDLKVSYISVESKQGD